MAKHKFLLEDVEKRLLGRKYPHARYLHVHAFVHMRGLPPDSFAMLFSFNAVLFFGLFFFILAYPFANNDVIHSSFAVPSCSF
jgi:hypothetical protein